MKEIKLKNSIVFLSSYFITVIETYFLKFCISNKIPRRQRADRKFFNVIVCHRVRHVVHRYRLLYEDDQVGPRGDIFVILRHHSPK